MTDDNIAERLSARRKRDIALLVLFAWPILSGVFDLLMYRSQWALFSSLIVCFVVQLGAVLAWCDFDARMRSFVMPGGMRGVIFVLTIVGLPWYLIRTRGLAGAAKRGFGLPVLFLSTAVYYGAWYGTRSVAEMLGYFG